MRRGKLATRPGSSCGRILLWALAAASALAALTVAPRPAAAFCGFNGAGGDMFNDATQVVLMRGGTRTVLSMQNAYQGPVADFALVIPVPVVLHEEDVKTLPKEVFAKVDTMGAPRLVEYWEQDPCEPEYDEDEAGGTGTMMALEEGKMGKGDADHGVTIEAQFVVGEYQIVILSAKDSTGLDTWLREQQYQIPAGAEPLLRPYVESGSKFFVAKVDPKKVTFVDGRAALSPLRFHYDSDAFTLPIRLGLANSSGTQDLIVTILSTEGRYQVANYDNVTIPTNLDVVDDVRDRFGEFYAALFDRTVEKHPGAVVTEYAWTAQSCDPCPGPQLDYHDLATLGADVVAGGGDDGRMGRGGGGGMVMTRLHARYRAGDVKDDLVFEHADAIVGGREFLQASGKLEEGAQPSRYGNNFQARYAIRHEWTGPIECKAPVRGRWGGPPQGTPSSPPAAARDLAFAPRGKVALAQLVAQDVPEVDVKAAGAAPATATAGPPAPTTAPHAGHQPP
ncbi:MAG: DUF2330 domain-containing protein, partial [Myxococcales bacterium]|nr:DUF2330 domain-containing protein [Myxococcales bacterium]